MELTNQMNDHLYTLLIFGRTVVFEVQENSDVTFRLYNWGRIDPKISKPWEARVGQAVACVDFDQIDIESVNRLRVLIYTNT